VALSFTLAQIEAKLRERVRDGEMTVTSSLWREGEVLDELNDGDDEVRSPLREGMHVHDSHRCSMHLVRHCSTLRWVQVRFSFPVAWVESSGASPPHRPREDVLADPVHTSRSNLASALGLLSRGRDWLVSFGLR
jgi:hypothetical protein